ncbi:MAG: PEGA domain-containing protein [Methanoregulaceae archaeon]|nr:PEGA domain-containing protein [Methanoregulaceae archaeon]
MKNMRLTLITIGILLLCAFLPVASATTIIAENGTIATVGGTDDVRITADSLPDGLSGFEITVTLADPAKAEIIQVITPAWAGNPPPLSVITSVPTDSVGILIIDFYGNVNHSVSNLELVTLRIRGDSTGTTGLNLKIETLQDKDGFAIAALVQNGTVTIGSTPPPPATGSLNVTSSPSAASVTLDGVSKGTTPIVIPNVTTGLHTVRVEKTGYQPLENLVTVNAGMTTNVHAVLSAIPPVPVNGTLNVQSAPASATVLLDGVNRGLTPLLIPDIPSGIHTLRLEKTGYTAWENPVTIIAGETTTVNATLIILPVPPVNGTLNVQSTPPAADMFLDGIYRGLTPRSLQDVPAGIHTLRLEKSGYQPFDNPVTIVAGGTTNVTVTMGTIPPVIVNGTLDVQSDPPAALVYLDAAYRGTTPLMVPNIPAGVHTLRLEKAGYVPWDNPVTIVAGEITNVTAVLSTIPLTNGSINVLSDPPGGNVYIDGVLVGISPVLLPGVSQGSHLVHIEKGGYEPWEEVVGVTAGMTTQVNATLVAIPPPPLSGSVNVQSNPEDANVYLDSVLVGLSPVLIPGVSPGTHTVRIEKTGYGPWESNVSVTAGATTLVSATLFPIPLPPTGSLNVQSDPSGANIFLDGVMEGITPALIPGVSTGLHTVRVEKTGFEPWESTVTITAGATTVVSVVLEPVPTPPTTGSISIESDPAGADARLDGVFKGTTPLSIVNVTPGSYVLTLNKTGYIPWEETITVIAGETTQIDEVLSPVVTPTPTPPAGYGSLYISSLPSRATVLIDGLERGMTDGVISTIPTGTRQVTLQKAGYKSQTLPVTIVKGKVVYLQRIVLEPDGQPTVVPTPGNTTIPTTTPTTVPTTMPTTIPVPDISSGSIFVYSLPLGCSVYIDDTYRGMSPSTFRGISPGEHTVRITFAGYQDDVQSVQVQRLKTSIVTAVLIPDISGLAAVFG